MSPELLDLKHRLAGKRMGSCRRLDDAELDLDQLPNLALDRQKLRCLAPAAVRQAVGRHNTRRCGRLRRVGHRRLCAFCSRL
jgi:hypothetical protein